MSLTRKSLFAAGLLWATAALGQSTREPHIGYLYPAGARRGTTVRIIAGGQYLSGPIDVHVSGKGVRASVVKYIRPLFNINKEQRYLLMKSMADVTRKRLTEAGVDRAIVAKTHAQTEKTLDRMKKLAYLQFYLGRRRLWRTIRSVLGISGLRKMMLKIKRF